MTGVMTRRPSVTVSGITTLVLLGLIAFLTATSVAGPVPARNASRTLHIPLSHSRLKRHIQYAGHARDNANLTQTTRPQTSTDADRIKRAGLGRSGMGVTYEDGLYYVEVMMGTPPKMYRMLPDTGSANFWVISADCKVKSPKHTGNTYDASQSTSSEDLHDDFVLKYIGEKKSTSGKMYTDIVLIGNIKSEKTPLGAASTLGDQFLERPHIDGILGLGRPRQSTVNHATFMQALVNKQLLSQAQFAITLIDPRLEDVVQEKSELTFGDFDIDDKKTLTWFNVQDDMTWNILLSSVSVSADGQQFTDIANTVTVEIDVGVTNIIGDLEKIRDLYKVIPGFVEHPPGSNSVTDFSVPCDTEATVELDFGIQTYILSGYQLHLGIEIYEKDMCLGGISGISNLDSWILGQTFLRTVQTFFSESGTPMGDCKVATCIGFAQ